MLMLISPAKSLDFDTVSKASLYSTPDFLEESAVLIEELKGLSPSDVASLMKISDKLAHLNVERFHDWHTPFTQKNAKQAVLAFQGDVYQGLEAETFTKKDETFAQDHLRILSGLYGLLRPYDLMQAYRLEMGSKFANSRGKNLYEFWGDSLTQTLNALVSEKKYKHVINLASNEYFKSIKPKQLAVPVVEPVFKDYKNGEYKIISFFAKKARGMMVQYVIKNKLKKVEDLKSFDTAGYYFSEADSTDSKLVFKREAQ